MTKNPERLIWEKDQKSQNITLEQLKESTAIQDFGGRYSKKAPLKHTDLIDNVFDVLYKLNNKIKVGDIFIAKNTTRKIKALDPEELGLFKGNIFESLITEILLPDLSNDEMTMKIAISYDNRGITLAKGTNITICSNMTIMGSSNVISTKGKEGLPYNKMIELFMSWIPNIGKTFSGYELAINKMKDVYLSNNGQLQELMGNMYLKSVAQAYTLGSKAPLTLNELSKFSQDLLKSETFKGENPITLWELYNIGTSILTRSDSNLSNKIELTQSFSDFIIEEYVPEAAQMINFNYD